MSEDKLGMVMYIKIARIKKVQKSEVNSLKRLMTFLISAKADGKERSNKERFQQRAPPWSGRSHLELPQLHPRSGCGDLKSGPRQLPAHPGRGRGETGRTERGKEGHFPHQLPKWICRWTVRVHRGHQMEGEFRKTTN